MNGFSVMRLFGDDMVLQSGAPNTIHGKAEAGAEVTASISDGTMTDEIGRTAADEKGSWSLVIPPFPPSFKSYTITFSCGGDTISAKDVLFGELYHISGQSNMELPVSRTIDPLDVHIPPDNEYIREFRVPVQCTFGMDEEYDDFQGGSWKKAVGDDIMSMSGVGYWFASSLADKLNVPVGFVNTSAGGAPCESRLPYRTLMRLGGYDEFLYQCTVPGYQQKTAAADAEKYRRWSTVLESQDKVSAGIFTGEQDYKKCSIPFYFRDMPDLDGFCGRVWFRKKFIIPDDMAVEDAVLVLGTMIDADKCYVNGEYVGETGYMYPPRIYKVPVSLLHHGENTVHVMLEIRTGKGGFVRDKNYCLNMGSCLIDLSGEWEYVIAAKDGVLAPDVFFQGLPLSMYGAMTAPSFGIHFKGLLWYQGESNDRAPWRYTELFREFVDMYRERCGYEIPVIFTQLPNFEDPTGDVPVNAWAQVREEQKKCLAIPDTAMAVTIGVGESNDLHPRNKRDIGRRLAYCARRLIYGDTSAPADVNPVSAVYDGSTVKISFDGKIVSKGDIKLFETVGNNGVLAAKAELSGNCITIRCDEKPYRVRYAWMNDPAVPDLFSEYELPLSPFEIRVTDSISTKETMLDGEIYIYECSPEHGDNGCAVILSHGYNQGVNNTGDMAQALAAAGYRAYALEFKGGSEKSHSKGWGTDMSVATEIGDLERVIAYVKSLSPLKLFLYGESQGGFVSALTAADRKDIDALALEYPAFCIPDQWAGKDPGELPDSFEFMGHIISQEYCRGVPRYDVYEKISHYTDPVLIMQGTSDQVVNVGYAHKIRQSFPNSGLILYEGEDHGFSDAGREKQKNDLLRFFDSIMLFGNKLTEFDDDYYRQLSPFENCQ